MPQEYQDQYSEVNELASRVRILEGKYTLVRERMFLLNQNLVDAHKKLITEIRSVDSDIKEIKGDLFTIKETLRHVIRELDSFAKKEDFKVLEKYINMWNPLNFVTEQEVLELIKKKVKKSGHKKR